MELLNVGKEFCYCWSAWFHIKGKKPMWLMIPFLHFYVISNKKAPICTKKESCTVTSLIIYIMIKNLKTAQKWRLSCDIVIQSPLVMLTFHIETGSSPCYSTFSPAPCWYLGAGNWGTHNRLGPTAHVEGLDDAPSCCPSPSSTLMVATTFGMNQQMKNLFLSLILSNA